MSATITSIDEKLLDSLADAVCDLEDEIREVIERTNVQPLASICACLSVVMDHVANEEGIIHLRSMFESYVDLWREENQQDQPPGELQ